jgi:hypothetical protein
MKLNDVTPEGTLNSHVDELDVSLGDSTSLYWK